MDQRVYIRLLAPEETRRRRRDDVEWRLRAGGQLTRIFFQTLLRVRPKPAAKLHYMKTKDAYEKKKTYRGCGCMENLFKETLIARCQISEWGNTSHTTRTENNTNWNHQSPECKRLHLSTCVLSVLRSWNVIELHLNCEIKIMHPINWVMETTHGKCHIGATRGLWKLQNGKN